MKILIYDLESYENDIYDIVSEHLNIDIIKVINKNEFFTILKKEPITKLIIDVSETIGEEIFNFITNTNPKQEILAISKTLSYNHTFTCEECDKLFNRKLLLKPLNPQHLISYIQNFNSLLCKYSSDSNEIVEIMADILKQFIYYSYDKEEKTIIRKKNISTDVKELIKITELLNRHNIRFDMENNNIKLYF